MDQGLVGRTGEPFEMVVEAGKVREFARATKATDPGQLGEDPVAPPTFLVTSSFWSGPENGAWPAGSLVMERVLHGEQEFVFPGPPPRAGARLTAVTRVADVYEKAGKRGGAMQFGVAVTEFRDAATGELVAESRSTLIETSKSTAEA